MPRQFEVSSYFVAPRKRAVVEDLTFASALASQRFRGKAPRSGRDRRAALVFQGGNAVLEIVLLWHP